MIGRNATLSDPARPKGGRKLTDSHSEHLKKRERVRIAGLGILQVRNRAARMQFHHGKLIQIKKSKKVAFRAVKVLKMAV